MAGAGRFGNAGLMIGTPPQRRQRSLEERFGAFADVVLKREGLIVDDPSRALLIGAISQAMTDASLKLARNAEGDYSPDENAKRFAPWPPPAASKASGLTLLGLFEKWVARDRTPSTVRRFRQIAASLDRFVGSKPAGEVMSGRRPLSRDFLRLCECLGCGHVFGLFCGINRPAGPDVSSATALRPITNSR